jgi:predicted proteasome-type protease
MKSALYEQRHKSAIIAHTIGTHMNVDCLLKNILIAFDSTLYTTMPLIRLQIELYFVKQNGQRTYKYLVLRRDKTYSGFVLLNLYVVFCRSLFVLSSFIF